MAVRQRKDISAWGGLILNHRKRFLRTSFATRRGLPEISPRSPTNLKNLGGNWVTGTLVCNVTSSGALSASQRMQEVGGLRLFSLLCDEPDVAPLNGPALFLSLTPLNLDSWLLDSQATASSLFEIWSSLDLSSRLFLRGMMLLADIEITSPGFKV